MPTLNIFPGQNVHGCMAVAKTSYNHITVDHSDDCAMESNPFRDAYHGLAPASSCVISLLTSYN